MSLDKEVIASLRAEFPALGRKLDGRPIVFFDGPGGTQVHGSVIGAMARYLVVENANTHGSFHHSRGTDETVLEARYALADLFHVRRPEEIVLGPNMTTLTFHVSRPVGRLLRPGDEIVVTRLDHDANVAPWPIEGP